MLYIYKRVGGTTQCVPLDDFKILGIFCVGLQGVIGTSPEAEGHKQTQTRKLQLVDSTRQEAVYVKIWISILKKGADGL